MMHGEKLSFGLDGKPARSESQQFSLVSDVLTLSNGYWTEQLPSPVGPHGHTTYVHLQPKAVDRLWAGVRVWVASGLASGVV